MLEKLSNSFNKKIIPYIKKTWRLTWWIFLIIFWLLPTYFIAFDDVPAIRWVWFSICCWGILICLGGLIDAMGVITLKKSRLSQIHPLKILLKTLRSATITIFLCATVYYGERVAPFSEAAYKKSDFLENFFTNIYFSVVTFSTLGYGDFSPQTGLSKFTSAFEAVSGNLHLGIFVGCIIWSLQYSSDGN